jgi:hypothetical protein
MNSSSTSSVWTNSLSVDEVAPSEKGNLCDLLNAILLDLVADQVGQLRTEKCCGCKVNHPNLVPRAFPFLSLGRREKALAPGGLLCILIGQ